MKAVYEKARELVSIGWCKHKSDIKIGGVQHYCINGALAQAHKEKKGDWPTTYEMVRLREPIFEKLGIRYDLAGWNDAPERTQVDVVKVLDAVVVSLS